jgi:chemotaxis protein CheY-P-specific phosphatase CheC
MEKKSSPEKSSSLSKVERKKLNDLWISCSANAVKALSQTLSREVELKSFSTKFMLINDVPKLMNPEDITTTVVWMRIGGEIGGVIVLCCSLSSMLKLADMLLHKEIGYFKDLSDENMAVINELGNIVAGYYMDTLVKLFSLKLEKPSLSTNPHKAIEFFGLGEVYREKIDVLLFESSFSIPEHTIEGKVILLFREELKEMILPRLFRM